MRTALRGALASALTIVLVLVPGGDARAGELVLADVQLFRGAGRGFEPGTLRTRDDRIESLGRPAEGPAGGGAGEAPEPLAAGPAWWVLPGLVDAHAHMLRAGTCAGDEGMGWANVRQIPMNFDVALSAGVTTAVDLGGPLRGAPALRDAVARRGREEEGEAYPRFLVAGPILTAPGGYPFDWVDRELAADLDIAFELASPAEARATVRELAGAGVDLVKVAAMDVAYNEKPLPLITDEVARAVVEEAHAHDLRVFVHAHTVAGYRTALAAGADVIAHSSFEPLPEDLVAEVAAAQVPVLPTLWVFAAFDEARRDPGLLEHLRPQLLPAFFAELEDFDRRAREGGDALPDDFLPGLTLSRLQEAMEGARGNLARLHAAGVPLGFGSDTSFCYGLHGDAARELGEYVRAGVPAAVALEAATAGSARALGRDDLGVLAPGAAADLIVLAADPSADVRALARPAAVVRGGEIVRCDPALLGERCPEGTAPTAEPPAFGRTLDLAWTLIRALYL